MNLMTSFQFTTPTGPNMFFFLNSGLLQCRKSSSKKHKGAKTGHMASLLSRYWLQGAPGALILLYCIHDTSNIGKCQPPTQEDWLGNKVGSGFLLWNSGRNFVTIMAAATMTGETIILLIVTRLSLLHRIYLHSVHNLFKIIIRYDNIPVNTMSLQESKCVPMMSWTQIFSGSWNFWSRSFQVYSDCDCLSVTEALDNLWAEPNGKFNPQQRGFPFLT